jgi:hypothetical protein
MADVQLHAPEPDARPVVNLPRRDQH